MGFALFFLGEYSNMILMSLLMSMLFLGGWYSLGDFTLGHWTLLTDYIPKVIWLGIKVLFFLYLFILIRAALPRYRYDQLMKLGWKVFLPLSLLFVIFYSNYLVYAYGTSCPDYNCIIDHSRIDY
jgi:NADH-quinone oxidoreductase subunit H